MTFQPPKQGVAWRKQEDSLHRKGQRRQPGSGNGDAKGDNKGVNFLIQCKTTMRGQTIIKLKDLTKMVREAREEDRVPVMQLQLRDTAKFAILTWEDFLGLLEDADTKP